ncbi:cytoplasmic dynein 2 heavy chain 1 [Leptopilina boulardi]|uniref:cytoplasmic dynein 2 heavy chain 1 n=1 Tax=Leptopilina boulardi TaxID=63433 RepID=UPI0021F5FB43|nr:cytoplasmic dynein 2 heavy chain 1 [Leptopilina boulardi]
MVVLDKRRTLIISTAGNFFGITSQLDSEIVDSSVLEKFLNQSSCRTLCAHPTFHEDNETFLNLTNELPIGKNTLVFFKVNEARVTEENFHDLVHVTSTGKNGGSSLIEALRQVWAPTLKSSGVDANSLRKLEEDILGPRPSLTIEEEELFWHRRSKELKKNDEKRTHLEVVSFLKKIRVELESAAVSKEGLAGLEETLEVASGFADDLWKLTGQIYSEERMKTLLDIVGNEVVTLVENLINGGKSSETRVKDETIELGASACEKWITVSERLTTLFWPHYSLHPWKGPAFTPKKCSKLGNRLKEIAEFRAQHRQLTRLLSSKERIGLGTNSVLDGFGDIDGLAEDHKDFDWERLRRRFEDGLVPAEKKVAEKLKTQIAEAKNSATMAEEFRRYRELIKRERIKRDLRSEREALLSAYNHLVESCRAGPDTENLLDTPLILQEIQTIRASEIKLENLQKLGKDLLADLPGYEEAAEKVASAAKDAGKKRQELVDNWISETTDAIASRELTLGTDSAVVELTGTSMMRVNYDPRLTTFIREARALAGQGVELPKEVKNLVERAGLLASRARALQQIANFHNTIGDRMVPSQRPLMLSAALELARAVQEQSGVVWSDPHAVDAYTARLNRLVKLFAQQNAELAAKHSTLNDLVSNLLKGDAVNLAVNQNTWKDTLKNMRTIVDSVEAEYGNTKAWKLHWDRQLLKALSIAYRAALPTLMKKLPEIRVELTFRYGSLQWRPTLEEIRAKIYSGIRRFLAIPTNFRGVGDPSDAEFHTLVQRCAYLYGGVYKEAEMVLSSLEALRCKWIPLAAPAKIDAGEQLKGKSPQEWERAFKEAKQWAQEVGKLRGSDVKIWCVVVDTATARNDLESASRRYWERMSFDLRAEASSRLVAIVDFLSASARELDKRPHNVEEIGLAYETYSRIQKASEGISKELDDVTGLARVLAAWTREKLEGISAAHATWESLTDKLQRHQAVMIRQVEDAKVNLRHKAIALRDDRERWETKWSSKPEDITIDWLDSMKERWTTLKNQKEALKSDCQRIGIDLGEIFQEEDNADSLEAELEAEEVNCKFQSEFIEELKKQEDEEWSVARRRIARLHDWLDSWDARLKVHSKDQEFDQERKKVLPESYVKKRIDEIRSAIEWIQILRGDELAEEHWAELKPILKLNVNTRDISLGDLLRCYKNIQENEDRVKEITKRATAESGIRQALVELEAWEGSTSLPLQESTDSKNSRIFLVGEYGPLLARAGELRLLLEGARGASGYERFASRASRCEAALYELEERIKILSVLQRKWVYLEPVYGGGAAPNDTGKWLRADKEFRYVMNEVVKDPRIPSLRKLPLPALTNLKDLLDRCQRSLDEFLEEKRSSYPRLYFLSDEDLLELVSGTGKGLETQLPKLYQGVGTIEREKNVIKSVVSPEGEVLKLPQPVDTTESLPQWLKNLEEGMRNALRQSLSKCLSDSSADPTLYPAQILLLSGRILFTEKCEVAIKEGKHSVKKLLEYLESQRAKFRGLEDAGDRLTSLKARGLLLDTVHHLQVTRNLLTILTNKENVSWSWSKQFRSYRRGNGAVIKCAGAEFSYRFEYQGAALGLVRTPLTERCFLALTQAMKLGLGGSPTGPAGTGKTESVKALGAFLGRLVIVFNCDEGMDAGSMRRILGGLAQAGAWGCFDEFNRLEEETLSAVAMLVRPLQEAVRDGASNVSLGSQNVPLDSHCCVFITMNPASNDYGGRHKLPDSLARLFRPIGMAHPDKINIVRALLECAGFLEASNLANQLVEIMDIAEKLLSKQPHYDWGLRALRSVLDSIPSNVKSDTSESMRLLIAIKASTLPKLNEEDTGKFFGLLQDVFPKINLSTVDSTDRVDLQKSLMEICEGRGWQENLISRCLQLNDQLQNRTGVAIVGPPGSGKTLVRKLLAEAFAKIGQPIVQIVVYPGAMPKSKLLGKVDSQTREWKEGLLANGVASAGDGPTWIVLNGDVEPGWAEALNSALDDNRILTLPNGVGMRLGSGTRFIFETHKLDAASPATVSRLGVLHLGSATISSLITPGILEGLPVIGKDIANTHLSSVIKQVLRINKEYSSASGLINSALPHLIKAHTQTLGTFSLLAPLCSQIKDSQKRDQLARSIYQLTDCWCPDPQKPFSILYNPETDRLEPLGNSNESVMSDSGPVNVSGTMKKAMEIILPWIGSCRSVLIRGPDGCGKTALIGMISSSIRDNEGESLVVVRGSSLYGPEDLIARLKRVCVQVESSSQGRTYRPRNGSRLILILEDLHLASKDLQELLRQLLQEGGFHEDDLEFASISLSVICSGDLNTKIHPRLNALLMIHYLPRQSSKDMVAIVELHLRNALKKNDVMVESWISRVAPAMVEAFGNIFPEDLSSRWSYKDLALWADSLRYYPLPEDESDITCYLIYSGRQLFRPKLKAIDLQKWEMIITSRVPNDKGLDDVFVWKGVGLSPMEKESWRKEIEGAAAKCAREGDPLQAVISSHLLQTTAGISWVLGNEQRGIVLIGKPGAGRKSSVRLVSTYLSMNVVSFGPGRGRPAIKAAVQGSAIDGEATILLLEEHHIREEGLAILAGAIVSQGEIPGLLTPEELDGLVAPLAELARREDFPGTLEQYFYHRLRTLLKVIIILDVHDVNAAWLSRSSLLKQCIVVGYGPGREWWTLEKSLMELASQQTDVEIENDSSGVKELVKAHLQVSRHQQAPARFLALLNVWSQLREKWTKEIEEKLQSLEAGISRLREAGERVAKLEEEADKQRQELEAEKGRANAALEQITATMRGATGQRGEMTTLKAATERESAELARRKADIESELSNVEPLVEQAAQAVAGIGADAISEVRSLRAPPAPVRDVLEGVLRLMGIRDTSWNSMKTFLAKRGVKEEIRSWDARRSTPASLEAVDKLVKERHESFEEKTAKRASVAAAPLAAWVLANLQYGQILQQVAPLEKEQRALAQSLAVAEAQLGKLSEGLNTVESKVAQLQEHLAAHSRGAAALQLKSEATEASLATARALLQKLDTEHCDWQNQFEALTARKTILVVEAADAASLLVYQDPSKDDHWRRSVLDLLINERERLLWRAQGLPIDTGSLVGAACALRGPLVPIFIDPSGVAVAWLRSNLGSRLEVTKPDDTKFLTTVELAVRFGKPLLVEDLVNFPSILLPLLRRRSLRLGDRILSCQHGFQLFLATRRERLDGLPSEADAVLFRLTLGAGTRSLAEKFIEKVILKETPEIEVQRREALEKEEKLAGERDAARLDLLVQLGAAKGQDLLQEGGLLSSLEATQSKAKEIALALEESRHSFEDVTRRMKEHEKLAKFAASFFKAVKFLNSLSPLYVFSNEALTDIYLDAEKDRNSLKADEKVERDKYLEKSLVALTLHHCTKTAYRKHRLALALHLALTISPVSEAEKNLLLNGENLAVNNSTEFKTPDWIPEERKVGVRALTSTLPQIASKMKASWFEDVGHIYAENTISPFEKVLVIQAIRPDHLHAALSKWAADQLGVRNLAPPTWTLKTVAEESGTYPVLLLLSPGADPCPELKSLAAGHVSQAAGFIEVSLGQGQVNQAEAALQEACRNGSWILLSNLQLALNWLPRLEGFLRSPMCTVDKNPSTRIWLTTEECLGFYPGLAGLCLKLAYEPPEGVKRNVKKSLQQLVQQSELGDSKKIVLLSWLHAILQERRKFVPQGWIKEYDWSEADLEAACELVVKTNNDDWDEGRGLLDVAVYGGRLQDDYDMRALRSILRNIWCNEIYRGQQKLGGILNVQEATLGDPVRSIDRLNDLESPQDYFGLPANAHRTWEKSASKRALALLKDIVVRVSSKEDKKHRKIETKTERDLKNWINQCLTDVKPTEGTNQNPLNEFFKDENNVAVNLLRIVQSDIESLHIEGMKVPKRWSSEWPTGPLEIIPFVNGLINRHQSLNSLNSSLPKRVNLFWFARPRAFLAALKQFTARECGKSLENLRLSANWSESTTAENWNTSITIDGLLLTGATIKKGFLKQVTMDDAPVIAIPGCQIAYLPKENDENLEISEDLKLEDDEFLNVPVYSDSQRNFLICSLPVGCPRDERDLWLRRGIFFHLTTF